MTTKLRDAPERPPCGFCGQDWTREGEDWVIHHPLSCVSHQQYPPGATEGVSLYRPNPWWTGSIDYGKRGK